MRDLDLFLLKEELHWDLPELHWSSGEFTCQYRGHGKFPHLHARQLSL